MPLPGQAATIILFTVLLSSPSYAVSERVVIGVGHEDRVMLVGLWDRQLGWVPASAANEGLAAGTRFTYYGPGGRVGEGTLTETEYDDSLELWWGTSTVSLGEGAPALAVAGASHPIMPRTPRRQDPGLATYRKAGAAVLADSGIRVAAARVAQSYRVDLDENGTDEVLFTVRSRDGIGRRPAIRRNDYAGVLLRYLPAHARAAQPTPVVRPLLLGAWTRAVSFGAPEDAEVLAVADLDGDGRLEVIVRTWYYEGEAITVFTFDGARLVPVLCTGWGA